MKRVTSGLLEIQTNGNTRQRAREKLGYSSHKGASTSARSYAHKEGFPWPIKSITKGESIYRCKRLGMSWMKISQRYGQSIKAVQRCAYKYAKRNERQWPPK